MDTVKTIIDGHELEMPARLMPAEPVTFSICLDDIHWFEDAFAAWEVNDFSGVLDGLNKAVKHFREQHDDLVMALQGEHKACDWLMSRLIELDPNFIPTESPIWPAVMQGSAALRKAGVN